MAAAAEAAAAEAVRRDRSASSFSLYSLVGADSSSEREEEAREWLAEPPVLPGCEAAPGPTAELGRLFFSGDSPVALATELSVAPCDCGKGGGLSSCS